MTLKYKDFLATYFSGSSFEESDMNCVVQYGLDAIELFRRFCAKLNVHLCDDFKDLLIESTNKYSSTYNQLIVELNRKLLRQFSKDYVVYDPNADFDWYGTLGN